MNTQIYGTIGPACEKEEILIQMFQAGMTGMRINMSHSNLSHCKEWIQTIQRAADKTKKQVKLLIDLKGPELRIGEITETILKEGEEVMLKAMETSDFSFDSHYVVIPVPQCIFPFLKKEQELLIDDGKVLIQVEKENYCRVIRGGILKPRKSIALLKSSLYPPTLTESDLENIAQIKKYNITGVMLPFVRNITDIQNLRKALREAGAEKTEIFSKIENQQGINTLKELILDTDYIVIARGDLGNAVPLWELPVIQHKIAMECKKTKTPFMVVTQMLASMEINSVPTRAEVSDIFSAVMQGASSVMLTGETAIGKYPVESMSYLCNTVKAAEEYLSEFKEKA